MANKKFWFGILAVVLVFGMAAIGCDNGTDDNGATDDGLTITGIPARFNGYFAIFVGECEDGDCCDYLFVGAETYNLDTSAITRVQISGGRVTLPIWDINYNENRQVRFSGNKTIYGPYSVVFINTVRASDYWFDEDTLEAMRSFNNLTFTNGNTTVSWNTGTDFEFGSD